MDSHSSRRIVTDTLKQPTRRHRGPRHCLPIWSCSRWGLPCRPVTRLAVRSYRTISPLPASRRTAGGIFLLHFPSARAAQALPGTVPCGARTFLGIVSDDATVWPAPPSTILRLSPPSNGESRDQVQLFETWSLDSGWGCRCRGNSIRCGRGPPLQGQKLRFGRGPPLQDQSESIGFGRGPPLQGDFVRRVVPRPAPTRGRGTSMYRSDEIPLQRRPSPNRSPGFAGPQPQHWYRFSAGTLVRRNLSLSVAKDAVVRGSGASRPWMACARLLEPWMAQPGDAHDPRTAAAPPRSRQIPVL